MNPFDLMYYEPITQILMVKAAQDRLDLRDKWQDEASEAAVDGNPQRASYIEWCIGRLG